jgi:hypothetical protein
MTRIKIIVGLLAFEDAEAMKKALQALEEVDVKNIDTAQM